MSISEIILISIALASDAFSVALSQGLYFNKIYIKKCISIGIWFGVFQFIMAFIGYIIGNIYETKLLYLNYYVAFALLIYIGIKMIKSSIESNNDILNNKNIFFLSIATSIDALAFGIAYACLYKYSRGYITFLCIGIITFTLSFIGCYIGNKISQKYEKISKVLGGLIIIIIAIKMILEHIKR